MVNLPKAILFDLDETLLSFGDRQALLTQVAEEFSEALAPITPTEAGETLEAAFVRFWSDETRHKKWRFHLKEARVVIVAGVLDAWRDRSPGFPPDLATRFAERFHELREVPTLFPSALETLDELRRSGVRLALVTNGDTRMQRAKVERFDLGRRFDHIQIEGEVGFGKPEGRAYEYAMESLQVEAPETWMVGDHLVWEVSAPQRLGIFGIWHDPLGKGLPSGSSVVPDRIIRSTSELLVQP